MPRRPLALLSSLFGAFFFAACAPSERSTAPDMEVRTATGVVNEDAVYAICGVPMRVQTVGKFKPIGTPVNGIIAFPQTTVRLTNLNTGVAISVNSSGTLKLRNENGVTVVDLRGRNVLVNTTKGTATLFVGTFTERVNEQGDGVYTGIGEMTNLCPQLVN
jgi:hypothetical protein